MTYYDTYLVSQGFQWLFWVINVLAFILYAWDKRRAMFHQKRIPEAILLLVALIGGSVGALCAMLLFRHKTRNPKFYITVPVLLAIQLVIYGYLCWAEII